jgi:hypothetical protein
MLKRVNVLVSLKRSCGIGIRKPSSSVVVIVNIIVANRRIVRMWSGTVLAETSRTHTWPTRPPPPLPLTNLRLFKARSKADAAALHPAAHTHAPRECEAPRNP